MAKVSTHDFISVFHFNHGMDPSFGWSQRVSAMSGGKLN